MQKCFAPNLIVSNVLARFVVIVLAQRRRASHRTLENQNFGNLNNIKAFLWRIDNIFVI